MSTWCSKCSRAPSTPARPSARASATSRTAIPRAICARWSTRASSKMDDLVELWKSPLIPNGPIVLRTSLTADTKQKVTDYLTKLPETDPACFSAVQGGDFKGFTPSQAGILPGHHRRPQGEDRLSQRPDAAGVSVLRRHCRAAPWGLGREDRAMSVTAAGQMPALDARRRHRRAPLAAARQPTALLYDRRSGPAAAGAFRFAVVRQRDQCRQILRPAALRFRLLHRPSAARLVRSGARPVRPAVAL